MVFNAMEHRDFESVLVGVDRYSGGRDAVALAKRLSAPRARIVLANISGYERIRPAGPSARAGRRMRAERLLVGAQRSASIQAESVVRRDRSPARGLHDLAEQEHADLLVIGSSHRGLVGRILLGDDTLAILNGSPCAVAIAPRGYASHDHRLAKIGVGHDGSPESELALDAARTIAKRDGSAIRVVSVVGLESLPQGEEEPLDWGAETDRAIRIERDRLARIEGVEGDVVYGDAGEQLAALADELDLLVVGSRGLGPWERLITGSISNYLARGTQCPLLVLPRRVSDPEPRASGLAQGRPGARQGAS